MLATGAAAVCPPLPGRDLEGVFVLRHMRDGRRMLRYFEEARPRTAVVVGAGYIGLEMAEAFRARGLRTTLVEASDKVMNALAGRARDTVADELRAGGVEVLFGERVSAFEGARAPGRTRSDGVGSRVRGGRGLRSASACGRRSRWPWRPG